jgi:hypothetical protein
MVLQGTLLVCLLELFLRGRRGDAEGVVEFCLFHHLGCSNGYLFRKREAKRLGCRSLAHFDRVSDFERFVGYLEVECL